MAWSTRPSKSRSISVTSPATLRRVSKLASRAPLPASITYTFLPLAPPPQDGDEVSASSHASYPPPMTTTGSLPLFKPLIRATFGNDQVWPIPAKPAVQPASSVEFGQPTRHLKAGADGVVTSKA